MFCDLSLDDLSFDGMPPLSAGAPLCTPSTAGSDFGPSEFPEYFWYPSGSSFTGSGRPFGVVEVPLIELLFEPRFALELPLPEFHFVPPKLLEFFADPPSDSDILGAVHPLLNRQRTLQQLLLIDIVTAS